MIEVGIVCGVMVALRLLAGPDRGPRADPGQRRRRTRRAPRAAGAASTLHWREHLAHLAQAALAVGTFLLIGTAVLWAGLDLGLATAAAVAAAFAAADPTIGARLPSLHSASPHPRPEHHRRPMAVEPGVSTVELVGVQAQQPLEPVQQRSTAEPARAIQQPCTDHRPPLSQRPWGRRRGDGLRRPRSPSAATPPRKG